MSRPLAASPPALPLLSWEQRRRLSEMERERAEMCRRLLRIAPRSRRRLEMEARICALTTEILAAHVHIERQAS